MNLPADRQRCKVPRCAFWRRRLESGWLPPVCDGHLELVTPALRASLQALAGKSALSVADGRAYTTLEAEALAQIARSEEQDGATPILNDGSL